MRKFRFEISAALCEMFLRLSLAVCPEGYSPSYVEAVIVAHERGLNNRGIGGAAISPRTEEDAA